jgi:hypothetical protein
VIITDTYTLQDFFQGCVPQLPCLTPRQRDRLVALSQMHPERRHQFLDPDDDDYPILKRYLEYNPERLRNILQEETWSDTPNRATIHTHSP